MKRITGETMTFLKKLAVFAALFFIADRAIGFVLHRFYTAYPDAAGYGIRDCRADILVLGSSRARHHYIPSVLSDSIGGSCFNLGSDGQNIYYHYAVLKSALERYRPRLVIIDLIWIDYDKTPSRYDTDMLTALLPMHDNPALDEVIALRGPAEKIKLLSKIYPYNSQAAAILGHVLGHNDDVGFTPLSGKLGPHEKTLRDNLINTFDYDERKIGYIEKAMRLCRDKGVGLVLAASPLYTDFHGKNPTDTLITIARRYGVPFLNFEQDTAFLNHPELFRDVQHLNAQGALLYSSEIASRIKRLGIGCRAAEKD